MKVESVSVGSERCLGAAVCAQSGVLDAGAERVATGMAEQASQGGGRIQLGARIWAVWSGQVVAPRRRQ